jgi:hypothetical protein
MNTNRCEKPVHFAPYHAQPISADGLMEQIRERAYEIFMEANSKRQAISPRHAWELAKAEVLEEPGFERGERPLWHPK